MAKDAKALRFQIQISPESQPALFEALNEAGAYYRSKRMLSLALSGLMAERSKSLHEQTKPALTANKPQDARDKKAAMSASITAIPEPVSSEPEHQPERNKYFFPETADDDMDKLFSSL